MFRFTNYEMEVMSMSDFRNNIQTAVDIANSMGLSDFMFQSPSSCRSRSRNTNRRNTSDNRRRTSRRRFTSRRRCTSRRRFTSRRRCTSRRRFTSQNRRRCRNWDDLMFGNRRRCGFRRF
jgi:hypothetical protein